jgi:hypothetical protein
MRFQDNLGLDIFLSRLCRDDRCPRTDIHKQHAINDTSRTRSRRRRQLGWVDDPLEPMDTSSTKEPVDVLEQSVLTVTSQVIPKSKGMILRDLRHDYGFCGDRRLQRCLARMAEKRKLIRIDLSYLNNGGDLRAYLHLGSRLVDDPLLIYEQLTNEFESSAYDHDRAVFERALRSDVDRVQRVKRFQAKAPRARLHV